MNKSRTAARPRMDMAETREFLAQVSKHPRLVDDLGDWELDEREVARFVARKAKTLFLVASHTDLARVQKLAELLFYSAYLNGRSKPKEELPENVGWDDLFETPDPAPGEAKEGIIQ